MGMRTLTYILLASNYDNSTNAVHLITLSYIDFIAAFMPYILLLKVDSVVQCIGLDIYKSARTDI